MTELDLASIQVNKPAYFLSLVQTRIKAASQGKLVIADRHPMSQPFEETELVKTSHASSHALSGELALSMNPAVKAGTSATQTSGIDRTTSEWNITPHIDEDVVGALRGVSAIWKYAHNDFVSDPVKNCAFNPKFYPRAMFGFQTVKTEVEFEVTLFWSSNRNSRELLGKRKDFHPIRWPWAKGNNPMFFNFLYQIAIAVDLERIPDVDSRIMPEMKIDSVKREHLNPSKYSVPLERTTETAESGQIDDIVLTDCKVIIKTAVEGRVELTPEERKGLNILCFPTRQMALKSLLYDRQPAVAVAGTSYGFTVIKRTRLVRLCRTFYASDPFAFSRTTAGPLLKIAIPWDSMATRPADSGNALTSYIS